jgi:hypothetical protein
MRASAPKLEKDQNKGQVKKSPPHDKMKFILTPFRICCIFWLTTVSIVNAQAIASHDESGFESATLMRLKVEFKDVFGYFSEIIEKKNYEEVYALSSESFRVDVSAGNFNKKRPDVEIGYKTELSLQEAYFIYDSGSGGRVVCLAVVRENIMPSGRSRLVTMTWVRDPKIEGWFFLNLPLTEYLNLPISARLRW